ncbi:hypothetical protein ACOMHN_048021 [Nucella lapillus]
MTEDTGVNTSDAGVGKTVVCCTLCLSPNIVVVITSLPLSTSSESSVNTPLVPYSSEELLNEPGVVSKAVDDGKREADDSLKVLPPPLLVEDCDALVMASKRREPFQFWVSDCEAVVSLCRGDCEKEA